MAPLDGAPRVLRLRVELAGFPLDPTRLVLVEGILGSRQLHELEKQKPSAALAKRFVEALTWSELPDREVLAPVAPLQAGQVYTVAMGDVPAALTMTVAATDTVPLLGRVWPPAGGSGTTAFAVWCGDAAVPGVDTAAVPAPGGFPGRIRSGAVSAEAGKRCLRFEATDPGGAVDGGSVETVPPPEVTSIDASVVVRLDPQPLRVNAVPLPLVRATCTPDEVSFGPGCVTVADDRLYGRSPEVPLLWAVAGSGADAVIAAAAGDPFAITGLPPSTAIALDVATVDIGGAVTRTMFGATTLPPQPHVVLNEVLAYPLGPRPDQEWVEIVNDGPAPAVLDGYVLTVGSGATPLPAATLAPGAFALIVDDAYAAAGGADVEPAPGTLLLRVPHLGKKGLSSAGEVFTLLDAGAKVVSSFPAKPKPKQGSSVARRMPSAPDALPNSFALAAPSPGRTNPW
jgi:hypothetical protein